MPELYGQAPEELFSSRMVQSQRILYTPSDFAKLNLTFLQEVGTLTSLRPHASRRAGLSSYLFFLVVRGHGTVSYGGTEYALAPGDCAFLDCCEPYEHRSADDLWTLKWVHFNGFNMEPIYRKFRERGGRACFAATDVPRLIGLLDDIYTVAGSVSYLRDMELYERLTALLSLLMKESWDEDLHAETAGKRQDLCAVRDYLNAHYAEKIRLDDLARRFLISKYYLTHIFKEQFGVTVSQHLLLTRITKAKQFLRFTDRSVEKIAFDVGYVDVNYFIRMFKQAEGLPPGEYRRSWRG